MLAHYTLKLSLLFLLMLFICSCVLIIRFSTFPLYHPHNHDVTVFFKMTLVGAEEMVQYLRALSALPEDPGLVPSTYVT
jgi:hypothetical protein